MSFYDLDYDSSYHRGYGEFRLIDQAFRRSETLSSMTLEDRVWKVTGRYIVKNLRAVIALTPATFDLYCEVRGAWAEMGFMAWSRAGYELHIRDLWRCFATAMAPELILAERLRTADSTVSEDCYRLLLAAVHCRPTRERWFAVSGAVYSIEVRTYCRDQANGTAVAKAGASALTRTFMVSSRATG